MTKKTDLKNLDLSELTDWVERLGQKKYRAKQLFNWIYQKRVESFAEMTDISASFREELNKIAFLSKLEMVTKQTATDGTRKYLFKLLDKNTIESVLIPDENRLTVCVSTQIGCLLECGFCLTGTSGFVRNLTSAEMVNQVLEVDKDAGRQKAEGGMQKAAKTRSRLIPQNANRVITNIVLMGMGEPLLNFENVVRAIRILSSTAGFNLAPKHITLSTAGIVPKLYDLAKAETKVNIALSLNATVNEQRSYLMPFNKKYPIEQVLQACRDYPIPQRRRITFEYVLIAGINDTLADAHRLVKLLNGIRCKLNLIPFNEVPGSPFKRPNPETVFQFQKVLLDNNYTAIIRESRGQDISAACGQLRFCGMR
ncbi:MAG: 23S rRNA (adenine(2503)-C(2))-methyltransferase RlmN [bacterium]|nr:23S rRNA (adenine(2503)-C(2))-methyltransferase RlmN [bacterium]